MKLLSALSTLQPVCPMPARFRLYPLFLMLVVLASPGALPGQQWTHAAVPNGPTASIGCGMAFDEALGKVLLFGGHSQGAAHDSTWTFDGTAWQLLAPIHRPSSRSTALAYDSVRSRTVLFGGWDGFTRLNDLWEWNGSDWLVQSPTSPVPPPRDSHAMAFDRARGCVVLFGGRSTSVGGRDTPLGDTWEWDGSAWHQYLPATSPPARWEHALAYDEARGRVVLFGGADNTSLPAATWTWDGSTWTQAQPLVSPSPRQGAVMSYDVARASVVLFGGDGGASHLSDTWAWDGQTWSQVLPAQQPQERWWPAMTYDRARDRMVMHGGIASPGGGVPSAWLADTWEFHHALPASYATFGVGCVGPNGLVPSLAPVAGQMPRIGFTSNLRVSNLPLSICIPIYAYGLSNSVCVGSFGPYALPFDLSVLGWSGCYQLVSLEITELEITNTGSADHPLVLPYVPNWVGLNFYAQSVVMYAPTGTAVTNAVHGVIGY